MTKRSDIDRVLETWFRDGPMAMPDRVIDVVADRIARQPQRRSWPFQGRTAVSTPLKLIVGLAAVLVVAVVGYNLLPRQPGVGGPSSSSSPLPITTPSPTPVVSPSSSDLLRALPAGPLEAGRYSIQPFFDVPSLANIMIAAEIPADWQGHPDVPALVSPSATSHDGALIGFMATDTLFSDPCHWNMDGSGAPDQPGDIEFGPNAVDLYAALRDNPAYASSHGEPFIIDGHQVFSLELQLPGDDVLATCDREPGGESRYLVVPGGFWAQGPDSRWRLFIIEVDGARLVTMISYFAGTPQADVAAAQQIVESFQIVP